MSSQSVSEGTFFQAKRLSRCLSLSSVFGAGSLYFVSSKIIQIVSRGVTSREFAGRSSFAIKFPNPSGTMSACAPPFSLQGFRGSYIIGHISSYRCARNFEIVKLNFFYLSVLQNYYAYTYSFFDNISHTFKQKNGHSLLGLSSKVLFFDHLFTSIVQTCSIVQQFL